MCRAPVRPRQTALLLACVLLLGAALLVAPVTADTVTTITADPIDMINADITGLTLTAADPSTTTGQAVTVSLVNTVLNDGALMVNFFSNAESAASSNALSISVLILDATVTDGTLVFAGYSAVNSGIYVDGVTATMTRTDPLVNMFTYTPGLASPMYLTHIDVEWTGGGAGGPVILGGGVYHCFQSGGFFARYIHAKMASNLFRLTGPYCGSSTINGTWCFNTHYGISSFDNNFCENCTGAMFNVTAGSSMAASYSGTLRFANNTITGGQAFVRSVNIFPLHSGTNYGHVIVSGIYSDGNLFDMPDNGYLVMRQESSYSIHHINVKALGIPTGQPLPYVDQTLAGTRQYVYIGNITENGVRFNEATQAGYSGMNINYAISVLVDEYGFVAHNPSALTGMGAAGTPSPSWMYCSRADTTALSLETFYGTSRTRPNCECDAKGLGPYCTLTADPYEFYDGYDASAVPPTTTTTTTTTTTNPTPSITAPLHGSPKLPTYAVILHIVGLLLSAVPLIIVTTCLMREHRLRQVERERRNLLMQRRQAEDDATKGSATLLESSLLPKIYSTSTLKK